MKCPKCGKELLKLENGKYICTPDCKMSYSEKELKDIQDIKMLNEDLEIWKEAQKYK